MSKSLRRGSVLEVLRAFLKLGCSSFGGPIAHLGYFRAEFVERRGWLDDQSYIDLIALCQFLPGPASSQIGMALGHKRAGWLGALAAWLGFTLPSAIALILFAYGIAQWPALALSGALHGLMVVAAAVVAQAVCAMAKSLCPDRLRAGIALGAASILIAAPSAVGQIWVILLGGLAGYWMQPQRPMLPAARSECSVSRRTGGVLLGLFALLLLLLPTLAVVWSSPWLSAASVFYRSGALVFGGGHVVLPLLQAGVVPPGWISNDIFLTGYGAAQALPGPLFAFAAYVGAAMFSPLGGWIGGLMLLGAIFLPAFLLVFGALPFWDTLRHRESVRRAMGGINAAVVGILAAALYEPVCTSAIHARSDCLLALAAFGLLVFARISPVLVVALGAVVGWGMST